VVRFAGPPGLPLPALACLPGAVTAREERAGSYALKGGDPDELLIEVALWSRGHGVRVTALRVERATLEDVFLQLTGDASLEGQVL